MYEDVEDEPGIEGRFPLLELKFEPIIPEEVRTSLDVERGSLGLARRTVGFLTVKWMFGGGVHFGVCKYASSCGAYSMSLAAFTSEITCQEEVRQALDREEERYMGEHFRRPLSVHQGWVFRSTYREES